ncbi:MAG TPA: 50S ribosomal protein L25 [Acidimicrobiales bacterium]|jgi:large subunit ribosomal protein L25|nr:50S ribosomal protein L25 [Acidimicrobiales bacterium]
MPSEVRLTASPRTAAGTRAAGRLRREGLVPAVVYGHGADPKSVSVVRRELRAALSTEAGSNALLDLQVEGEAVLALVKEMQRDAVRNEVTHVDFIRVSRDEAVVVEVPIHFEGEASEVTSGGGTLDQQLFNLTVTAKPGDIPSAITVDVSGMSIGDSVRVGDLSLPRGVTTDVDPEEAVAVAQVSQAAQEAEALDMEAAAALEAEEGEAAEGEGAEAASADAAPGDEAPSDGEPGAEGES